MLQLWLKERAGPTCGSEAGWLLRGDVRAASDCDVRAASECDVNSGEQSSS